MTEGTLLVDIWKVDRSFMEQIFRIRKMGSTKRSVSTAILMQYGDQGPESVAVEYNLAAFAASELAAAAHPLIVSNRYGKFSCSRSLVVAPFIEKTAQLVLADIPYRSHEHAP